MAGKSDPNFDVCSRLAAEESESPSRARVHAACTNSTIPRTLPHVAETCSRYRVRSGAPWSTERFQGAGEVGKLTPYKGRRPKPTRNPLDLTRQCFWLA